MHDDLRVWVRDAAWRVIPRAFQSGAGVSGVRIQRWPNFCAGMVGGPIVASISTAGASKAAL